MGDSVQELNHKLLDQMKVQSALMQAQGERHSIEIAGVTSEIRENTQVVRECLTRITEHDTDKSNLIKCLSEIKAELKDNHDGLHSTQIKLTELDTRWAMTKVMFGMMATLIGIAIAIVKLF